MKNNITTIIALLTAITFSSISAVEMKSDSQPVIKPSLSRAELEVKKAREGATTLSDSQKTLLLALLNNGTEKELGTIKGIGSTRAKAVIKQRPFVQVEEIVKVEGIGLSTFTKVIEHSKNPPKAELPKTEKLPKTEA